MTIIWIVAFLVLLVAALSVAYTLRRDASLRAAFPALGHFTTVPGGEIHWTVQGQGPVVVLVHGLAGNLHNFNALEKQLASRYTVYCLDRPGSGHSQRNLSTDPGFDSQARMIIAWMDAIHLDKALFVGHSMGGAISLNLAIQAPQKVTGLALICPLTAPLSIKPSRMAKVYFRSPSLRLAVAKGLSPMIQRHMGRKQVNAIFKPEVPAADFAHRYGGALSMLSSAFLGASGDLSHAQRSLREQIRRYSEIQCPVSILFGDGDRILPYREHTQIIRDNILQADITVMPDRGHMLPITAVDECAAMIDKVAQQSRGQTDSVKDGLA